LYAGVIRRPLMARIPRCSSPARTVQCRPTQPIFQWRQAMTLNLTTFNLENLFSRYTLLDDPGARNEAHVQLVGVTSIDYSGRPLPEALTLLQRNNTARAILDSKPDILAVQEVENLWTLRCFNDEYLGGYFDRMILCEGNDGRGIDVALCVRFGCDVKIEGVRSHVDDLNPADETATRVNRYYNSSTNEITVNHALFSRDCLEVDIDAGGTRLTFLVNHFKSQDGTKKSDALRKAQAGRVASLVGEVQARGRRVVVMGDLNEDWSQHANLKPLQDLLATGKLADPFHGAQDCWTHFYAATGEPSRLDYILVDGALKDAIRSPSILRKGLSLKCTAAGDRYPTVGYVDTEASDHCPVTITLELGSKHAAR
jgi:endonuclease/exonuclease/phosphatase family metal-dependent hydrolase